MPTHLEDSDGNNADDDSIDSFMQRQNNFGYRENDDVPTRDVGPERLPNHFSQVCFNYERITELSYMVHTNINKVHIY